MTDKSGCSWLPEVQLSSAFETPGLQAFLAVEKTHPSWQKLGFHLQNSLYATVASRQNLPLLKSLTGLGFPRPGSHLPLKHWGSVLFCLWKRTVVLIQIPMAEIGIPLPKSHLSKGCSQTSTTRTDRSGCLCPHGEPPLIFPLNTWTLCFSFLWKRTVILPQVPMAKTGILDPKFCISRLLPDKC